MSIFDSQLQKVNDDPVVEGMPAPVYGQVMNFLELTVGAGGETAILMNSVGAMFGGKTLDDAKAYIKTDGTFKFKNANGDTIMDETGLGIDSVSNLLNIQGWSFSGVFSATDSDTVEWTAGTITLADGTTFSILAGNTGNMAALSYIYFNKAVSETVLQVTTTPGTAVGANKILIAVAKNETGKNATFQAFGGKGVGVLITADNIAANTITGNEIAANTISANKMTVSQLSAIAANLGSITAGTLTACTFQNAASGAKLTIDGNNLNYHDGSDATFNVAFVNSSGWGDAGDVRIGKVASGKYILWDNSAGTLTIRGSLNADDITAGTLTGRTLRTAAPGAGVGASVVITGGNGQNVAFYYDSDSRGDIGGYTTEGSEITYIQMVA
ncbi:MAG: hypothetical protein PHV59_08090, partial [Victivallales bacterium]|nr:hypothetical protein [Victivallales bacterium]